MLARCFKHLSENTKKAMTSIKESRNIVVVCNYQLGKVRTKQWWEQTLQNFKALHLEGAEWFDKKAPPFC
jgi:hypothetical protein